MTKFKRYPPPAFEEPATPEQSLELIRYLTGEWLSSPGIFGQWAGGCYMEALHKLANTGLEVVCKPPTAVAGDSSGLPTP